ncbi:MAG: gamma-glutamyltransferase, partial [Pseudomonadota bacterium]
MNRLHRIITALLMLHLAIATAQTSAQPAPVEHEPIIDFKERFLPTVAENAMVVGPERLAGEIGVRILQQGGNVVDAAVATGFALAVTYPRAGNLGGGGFMLVHLAEENKDIFIDYRETAPAAATRDMFIGDDGKEDFQLEFFSLLSSGVPGTVAGMLYALENYGTMTRQQVLAPAIELAEAGFPVSFALNFEIAARAERLLGNPESSRLFFNADGSQMAIGEIWKQPDLAWTLKQIAKDGNAAFYRGAIADKIVAAMEDGGGLISKRDLANYRVVERSPVRGTFKEFEIVSAPPPSSGGVHIVQMLNMLENDDLKAMGHNSAAYLHLLSEIMRLAYADRSEYLADPAFADVPVAELMDKDYAQRQRGLLSAESATPSEEVSPGKVLLQESEDTTQYTIADAQGNMVSNTYTLNASFGSGISVPGTGFLLNNEMGDFSALPGQPNMFGLLQGERNA